MYFQKFLPYKLPKRFKKLKIKMKNDAIYYQLNELLNKKCIWYEYKWTNSSIDIIFYEKETKCPTIDGNGTQHVMMHFDDSSSSSAAVCKCNNKFIINICKCSK